MRHLSNGDMLAVLDSINILNSDISFDSLADRTLKSVLSLIPSEMTAFDGFNQETGYQNSYWYSPPGTVSMDQVKVLSELIHEHPYYAEGVSTQHEALFRVSDYLPLKNFHKLAVYNEFYRHFEGEAQISCAFSIAPKSVVTCSLLRPKLDFSDREFTLLGLLTPHLAAAFRNALAYQQLERERKYLSLSTTKGIVVMDSAQNIKFMSDLASRLFEKYVPDFERDVLPEELLRFVEEQNARLSGREYSKPAELLRMRRQDSELQIRLAFDFNADELKLFIEEKKDLSPADLASLGLTRRETIVIYWICNGKTDDTIGRICGINVRTVQKHVENIFIKLGVETRTAAMSYALQITQR